MDNSIMHMIETMELPSRFSSPSMPHDLIAACEADFESRLTCMAEEVSRECLSAGVHVIRLSGPSCAGKTTVARKLTKALEAGGLTVYPISLDDFYYERDVLLSRSVARQGMELDYDSVDTLDITELKTCVEDLLSKGKARIPVYRFATGTRDTYSVLEVPHGVRPVFLFEGIQAVYPKVTSLFDGIPSRSIFVNACRPLTVGGHTFQPHRLRLLRRLVRDATLRGANVAFTLALWRGVRANEKACILPYTSLCHYAVDTTMAYEVHVLAPHLVRLLTVAVESETTVAAPIASIARELLESIADVQQIASADLPKDSLYREFVPVCID